MNKEKIEFLKIGKCIYCEKDIPNNEDNHIICPDCLNLNINQLELMNAILKIKTEIKARKYEYQIKLDKLKYEQLIRCRNRRKYYSGF